MAANGAQFPEKLGPYELIRLLATGGMAEVYLARRDGPHGFTKTVALKRILPQLARDQDFVSMFVDEARVCAQLSHPNLVQVFDFGEAGAELYMAMEYVDGTTCAKVVRKAASLATGVPLDAALHVVLSILRGLEYAHEAVDMDGIPLGLVHRDVSPGNILIARSGAVKLGDFGIARADDFERRTEEGQLKGKLGYMSPEQVTGQTIDARSDLFTLGIVLAEILVCRPLFGTGNELDVLMRIRDADLTVFERHGASVPEELRVIVRKALAQSPSKRFQTATAFAEAIEDFVRQKRIAVGPSRLVAWLEQSGLVSASRASGEHPQVTPKPFARVSRTPRPGSSPQIPAQPEPPRPPEPPASTAGPTLFREPQTTAVPDPSEHTEPRIVLETVAMPAAKGPNLPSPMRPTPLEVPAIRPTESSPLEGVSPAVYRVLTPERIIGPIPYPHLVELFATGQVDSEALVARGSGSFRSARDLPELARLLVSPALSGPPDKAVERRDSWILDRALHPSRLFELARQKETGLLVSQAGHRMKKFFLVDGAPVFTTSTDKRELLGEQLVARGMALPMEIDMALALCPRYGGRLGDALVGLGVLRPVELFRALVAQTHDRMVELLSWRQGQLEFLRGVRTEGETLLHGVSTYELIAKGVLKGYSEQELTDLLLPYWDAELRAESEPEVPVKALRLSDRMTAVLLAFAKPLTLGTVVDQLPDKGQAPRDEVLKAVFVGLSAKILAVEGWPPDSARPTAPTQPMPTMG